MATSVEIFEHLTAHIEAHGREYTRAEVLAGQNRAAQSELLHGEYKEWGSSVVPNIIQRGETVARGIERQAEASVAYTSPHYEIETKITGLLAIRAFLIGPDVEFTLDRQGIRWLLHGSMRFDLPPDTADTPNGHHEVDTILAYHSDHPEVGDPSHHASIQFIIDHAPLLETPLSDRAQIVQSLKGHPDLSAGGAIIHPTSVAVPTPTEVHQAIDWMMQRS